MWTGQKLLHVIFSCKMLQIADGHNSGHTEVTAAGPERRRQLWREYNVGDYCRVSPDVMSGTCWRRESGENVGWTAERCQRGPGLCLARNMTALALSCKQSPGAGATGESPVETVYRAGQAGQVRSEADLFGSENLRFWFCFRMSPHSIMMFILWLVAVWFSWGGEFAWEAQFMMVLEVGKIKLITSYTWHNFCH